MVCVANWVVFMVGRVHLYPFGYEYYGLFKGKRRITGKIFRKIPSMTPRKWSEKLNSYSGISMLGNRHNIRDSYLFHLPKQTSSSWYSMYMRYEWESKIQKLWGCLLLLTEDGQESEQYHFSYVRSNLARKHRYAILKITNRYIQKAKERGQWWRPQ